MEKGLLEDRRKALEEEYFRKEDERLRAELRARQARDDLRQMVRQAGVLQDAVADQLADALHAAGVGGQALVALEAVPLVHVAWADGDVDAAERDAVLRAVRDLGMREDGPGYQTLQRWLTDRPEPHLFDAWLAYVRDLSTRMDAAARQDLREQIVGATQAVAKAAGGFLGIKAVSPEERDALAEVEAAFGA